MSKPVILSDADDTTPGETAVHIGYTTKSLEIRPEGTGLKTHLEGAPILIERYKGHIRVVIWADINQEDPTHIVSLAGAYEGSLGQPEGHKELVIKSIPAKYISEWSNGIKVEVKCLFHSELNLCFDIEDTDVDTGESECVDEYVILGDLQMRASDGVTFNY